MDKVELLADEIASRAIEEIETRTLDLGMSLANAARVCRIVAAEVRERQSMFEDEARRSE